MFLLLTERVPGPTDSAIHPIQSPSTAQRTMANARSLSPLLGPCNSVPVSLALFPTGHGYGLRIFSDRGLQAATLKD